ncbi:MAG: tetratricopeptide repeat protein [Pyrinomonadaceae bacterium]|nr:tetratricopeptide repeat protein [Pyrinomonadaceae bacterium]
MSNTDRTNITSLHPEPDVTVAEQPTVSIRVSPHGYLKGLMLGTYFTGLLFYLHFDVAAYLVFCISWILIPFFTLNDRISFDGRRLARSGLLPRLWTWFNGGRKRLRITDVEQVETQAVRAIRRGGNIYYRYRTVLHGKGLGITLASGGEAFRQMLAAILPKLHNDSLDLRSSDLRDFLSDPKETLMKAEFARIPSADMLEAEMARHRARQRTETQHVGDTDMNADELQVMGNELRLAGYLPQALESFRRALVIRPSDARLIFDFARCLNSYAAVRRNSGLTRRSVAALRLSERRAGDDRALLSEIGECYVQFGEWRRASEAFRRVVDRVGGDFRAARGLAELALRDGKVAHVIHHFAAANRVASTPALRRWARGEADYFSRLNDDEEYMETEVSRVNLLESVERARRTALRIALLAFPAVFIGVFFEDALIANIGWAVTTVVLLIWTGLFVTARMLSRRIPYELVASDD